MTPVTAAQVQTAVEAGITYIATLPVTPGYVKWILSGLDAVFAQTGIYVVIANELNTLLAKVP